MNTRGILLTLLILIAVAIALTFSSCASNKIGNSHLGSVATNKSRMVYGDGLAGLVAATNYDYAQKANEAWNENGTVEFPAKLTSPQEAFIPTQDQVGYAMQTGQLGHFYAVGDQNQTKGTGLIITGVVAKFFTDMWTTLGLAEEATSQAIGLAKEQTAQAGIEAAKDEAITGLLQ